MTRTSKGQPWAESHPFLSFNVPSDLPPQVWMLLAEIQSKCDHIRMTPIAPDLQKNLQVVYLAKGALGSAAIEGNELSEDQVLQIIDGASDLPASQEYQRREVQNIVDACNETLRDVLRSPHPALTVEWIRRYNRMVLDELEVEDGVVPGEWADSTRVVGSYRAPSPAYAAPLLGHLCDWLNGDAFRPQVPGHDTAVAVLRAIFGHLYLAWIHPFGDGNGRTARMVEFLLLISAGVPAPAAHLLSNHYNLTRSRYYRELAKASRSKDPVGFVLYAVQGFVDGLKEQLALIQESQWIAAWESYVHESFSDAKTPALRRQRELVLAMSRVEGPVGRGDIPTLNPSLAEKYAGKGSKTVTRDLNALKARGLVRKDHDGFRTNREILVRFQAVFANR